MNMFKMIKKYKYKLPIIEEVYVYKLNPETDFKDQNNNEISYRVIQESDLCDLSRFRDNRTVEHLTSLFFNGNIIIGAFNNDKFIGHASCCLPNDTYKYYRITKSAFIHFCYVDPQYRGRGIYPGLVKTIMELVTKQYAIRDFSISTSKKNYASQRGIEKIGYLYKKQKIGILFGKTILFPIVV